MPANPTTLRVALVDDQQLVRSGFRLMLSAEPHIDVVGEAENGIEAIDLARDVRPDIMLMDIQMPVLDGIGATQQIVADDLSRVIVLTTFDSDEYLFGALDAGASGFLLKTASPEQLIEALDVVGRGHALLSPEVTRRLIARKVGHRGTPAQPSTPRGPGGATVDGSVHAEHAEALGRLTAREREILGYLGRGLSNAEIAADLVVGEATVKTHVSHVLAKLGVRDRIQAVIFAYESGVAGSERR